MVRGTALVALVLALAASSPALADAGSDAAAATPLAQAESLLAASDYTSAGAALDAALAAGNNSPDDLAKIYQLRGIVAAALGDGPTATDAFAHLLALRPAAALPAGTSPKITRPFSAAQDAAHAAGALEVRVETTPGAPGHPPVVTLVVAHDPLAMIVRARATFTLDGRPAPPREASGADRIAIELPLAAQIALHVDALDAHGNRVVELGTTEQIAIASTVPAVVAPRPVVAPRAGPLYLAWPLYAGLGVVAAAVGGGYLLEAHSATNAADAIYADPLHHTYPQAQHEESRAQSDLTGANVGFVAAGLFAAAGVALWATRPHDAHAREHAQIVPTAARTGAGLAVEMPW